MMKFQTIPLWMMIAFAVVFAGCDRQTSHQSEHSADDGHNHAAEVSMPADDGHGHAAEAAAGHSDEVTMTSEAIVMNKIQVTELVKQQLPDSFRVTGRVAFNSEKMAHVGTHAQGRVVEVKVTLGQQVKVGDVLAEIDSPALGEAQSDYLQKRTQNDVSQAAAEAALLSKDRVERLYATGGIGLGEFQKREGETSVALGASRTARAAMQAAENKLHLLGIDQAAIQKLENTGEVNSRYSVTAPIDGQVIEREITPGEMVGPEREALIVLADMRTLWVLVDVPEVRLPRLKKFMHAMVTTENMKTPVDGRVVYIAPELSRETRTVLARVELDAESASLLPGMFASVILTNDTATGESVLAVPEGAVQQFEGKNVVFAAAEGEENTFLAVPVETGNPVNGMVPLVVGVREGMEVVTEGAFIVKAEMAKAVMEGKTCSGH